MTSQKYQDGTKKILKKILATKLIYFVLKYFKSLKLKGKSRQKWPTVFIGQIELAYFLENFL